MVVFDPMSIMIRRRRHSLMWQSALFAESKSVASLPCLTFFWPKKVQVWAVFLPFLGVANEQKDPKGSCTYYVCIM